MLLKRTIFILFICFIGLFILPFSSIGHAENELPGITTTKNSIKLDR